MVIWIDDIRPMPVKSINWFHCESTNKAIGTIMMCEGLGITIEYLDIDHDAGDYATDGGDFINVLNWLEETGRNYPIHIHTANPVGRQNMRAIIEHNGWREIL